MPRVSDEEIYTRLNNGATIIPLVHDLLLDLQEARQQIVSLTEAGYQLRNRECDCYCVTEHTCYACSCKAEWDAAVKGEPNNERDLRGVPLKYDCAERMKVV